MFFQNQLFKTKLFHFVIEIFKSNLYHSLINFEFL